jgi:intracellular sulfur oxidation DsrE/DsrF family protein
MRKINLLICVLLINLTAWAQGPKDSAASARRDSLLFAKMLEKAQYPLIKGTPMGGVMPVSNPDEKPDPSMQYKLILNFVQGATSATKSKAINGALAEAARLINLHIAAGVPKENLNVVVIAHGQALFSLLNNEAYQKKFKTDNPNAALVKELQDAGVKFTSCGQAMQFLEVEKESMLPGIRVGYSAKTIISTYCSKGYLLTDVNE